MRGAAVVKSKIDSNDRVVFKVTSGIDIPGVGAVPGDGDAHEVRGGVDGLGR